MNKENKTLSDALLVLLNDYEKGNVSSIKFSMDATLVNEKLIELELKNEKLMAENEEFKKLLEKVRNCKVGDLVLYHPTDDVDSHYVFETMNKLKDENEKLKSDLKIAADALNKNKKEWEVVHPNGFKCLVAWQMCRDTVAALQARIDGYEKIEGEK